jgi:cytochrome c biogenesis protein CcmG, thiol:disulfide interchange protein DsbE
MRRLILLGLLLFSSQAYALSINDIAPNFSLSDKNNQLVSIQDYKGEIVYLDFWASWCAPCKSSFPWMNEIQKEFENKNFKIIAINLDNSKDEAERFLSEHTSNITILFDQTGKTPELYGVHSMPSSYLIDTSGRIVAVFEGFHDEDKSKIKDKINEMLSIKK